MIKKIIITLFLALIICVPGVSADAAATQSYIEETFTDGSYIESIILPGIEKSPLAAFSADKSITKTKLSQYKNSYGTTLWSLSITASFTYNGTSARCTSCTPNAAVYNNSWKVKSLSSSKSGNHATANATMTHSVNNISNNTQKSVTITCSKNGAVS